MPTAAADVPEVTERRPSTGYVGAMRETDDAGRFACGTCGARYPENGTCKPCGDPLLDLSDDEVRIMLVEDDARRHQARYKLLLAATIPLAAAIAIGGSFLSTDVANLFRAIPFGLGYAAGIAGLAMALNEGAMRLLPPKKRFAYLDE